jgi:glucose-6-phosphate isomerase
MDSDMSNSLWQRYRDYLCDCPFIGLTLDISRMNFASDFLGRMEPAMARAYQAMEALERGAIANPDEGRMVGHYWLREPQLAPTREIAGQITETLKRVRTLAAEVHGGTVAPPRGGKFTDLLVIGIGGSALGPQFVADALGDPQHDRMAVHFFDNTDPDGIDRTLRRIGARLPHTLAIVISKSGGTPETRNGMLLAEAAYRLMGLDFAQHAVAITGEGSRLDKLAADEKWLMRLPMWDWVGGRTSELGPVGLLPAALQGIDVDEMLTGAAECDKVTRVHDTRRNPAALLALMWYHATDGRGEKDMVVLPYKDRLLLFSRYLQQLVMESLGKGRDLAGRPVEQGIAVYGNKGSTDQHAYVQQLREGVNNFFVTFVRVLKDGGSRQEVEPGVTAGDYLHGFWLGTRNALHESGRESITITINEVSPFAIGVLIALFERAVGYYASLININAYDQPGVEAGKKAASAVLDLQRKVQEMMAKSRTPAAEFSEAFADPEDVIHILEHLIANGRAMRRQAKP